MRIWRQSFLHSQQGSLTRYFREARGLRDVDVECDLMPSIPLSGGLIGGTSPEPYLKYTQYWLSIRMRIYNCNMSIQCCIPDSKTI